MANTKFIKVTSETSPMVFWEGAKCYLKDGYGSGMKYIAAVLSNTHMLIADNKKDCNDGRGYIHHRSDIDRVQLW